MKTDCDRQSKPKAKHEVSKYTKSKDSQIRKKSGNDIEINKYTNRIQNFFVPFPSYLLTWIPRGPVGPGKPCLPASPGSPAVPWSPGAPGAPGSPRSPTSPRLPCTPWMPCAPGSPCSPRSPWAPFGPKGVGRKMFYIYSALRIIWSAGDRKIVFKLSGLEFIRLKFCIK